jgi:hypothetical protein
MLAVSGQTVANNRPLYQLKVILQDIQPLIWRRIQVWEDITLAQLHTVLQIVMNWENCHLHDFVVGRHRYSVPDLDDDMYERKVLDEKLSRLNEVGLRVGTHFEYLYDFGDSWRHDLLLEAILMAQPNIQYPRCVAGERRTPPEGVSGTLGYEDYLAAIADPAHSEHENMLLWRGPFNPETFSTAPINQRLQKKFRARKKPLKSTAATLTSNPLH